MMSLVADYGSSDNDSDLEEQRKASENPEMSETSEESASDKCMDEISNKKIVSQATTKLPSAKDLLGSSSGVGIQGVLTNKYKAAEDQKIASLERHVKMVNTDLNTKTKNGKKICWSYRKGKCRFGSACTFAHDSDVQSVVGTETNTTKTEKVKSVSGVTDKITKKKRPGLSNSLVPGKKVVQMYKHLKKS